MLICVIDASIYACECFCFYKLMINVEEVMYYACSAYKCIIRIISVNMCHIIQNFYMVSELFIIRSTIQEVFTFYFFRQSL